MRRLVLSIMLLLFTTIPGFCQVQWEALKDLHTGKKIVVLETTMRSLEGKFVSVSDETINLDVAGQQVSIKRQNVARVSSKGHRVRNTVLLTIVGLLGGAYIGHTQDTPTNTRDGIGAVIGGVAGGVGGALIPTGKTYYRLEKPPLQPAGK
jgi:hypothetical protein